MDCILGLVLFTVDGSLGWYQALVCRSMCACSGQSSKKSLVLAGEIFLSQVIFDVVGFIMMLVLL